MITVVMLSMSRLSMLVLATEMVIVDDGWSISMIGRELLYSLTITGNGYSAINVENPSVNMFIKTAASFIVVAMNFQRMREEPTIHEESER